MKRIKIYIAEKAQLVALRIIRNMGILDDKEHKRLRINAKLFFGQKRVETQTPKMPEFREVKITEVPSEVLVRVKDYMCQKEEYEAAATIQKELDARKNK